MITNLASTSGTGLSITNEATVDTYTAAADGLLSGLVRLTNLNAAAATLTLKIQLLDASNNKIGVPVSYSIAKDATSDTTAALGWGPVRVVSGQKVRARVQSTNSSDTNASWSFIADDAFAVDTRYFGGTLQTGRDIGLALPSAASGGSGGLPVLDANFTIPADLASVSGDLTTPAKIAAYWLRVLSGTAQAGAASTITLATGSSSTDNFYQGWTVHLVNGTGNSQTRTIVSYVGSTKVATVDRAWTTNPTSSTDYQLKPPPSSPYTAAMFAALMNQTAFNIAQAGSSTTITLASSETSTDDAFKDAWVYISSGTGAKQKPQQISGYIGSTKVATISGTWQTTPDSTSVYQIIR